MTSILSVVCIGGAAVDRTYRASSPLRLGTSNPVASARSFGGVARNVAETLARLGTRTTLVSAVGGDDDGRALLAHLAELGVDVAQARTVPGLPTAAYVAVIEPEGGLALGLADMAVLDELTPPTLAEAERAIAAAGLVFADCNLPAATLAALIARRRSGRSPRVVVDAVSVPKAARLPADLAGLDLLFLNRDEAAALLGDAFPPDVAAERLQGRGAGAVVLTLGPDGVLIRMDHGEGLRLTAPRVPVVADVTGAGDALIAGTVHRLAAGADLVSAVRTGLATAALALERPGGVRADLSPALLESAMRGLP